MRWRGTRQRGYAEWRDILPSREKGRRRSVGAGNEQALSSGPEKSQSLVRDREAHLRGDKKMGDRQDKGPRGRSIKRRRADNLVGRSAQLGRARRQMSAQSAFSPPPSQHWPSLPPCCQDRELVEESSRGGSEQPTSGRLSRGLMQIDRMKYASLQVFRDGLEGCSWSTIRPSIASPPSASPTDRPVADAVFTHNLLTWIPSSAD